MDPRRPLPRSLICFLATVLVVGLLGTSPAAASNSLPRVTQGPRPGPAPLYWKPAHSALLANVAPWQAKPILVSGAAAYSRGEFIYQDYLDDDHGPNTTDTGDDPQPRPDSLADLAFGGQTGDAVYPTDAKRYGYNNADLVELRLKPLPHAVAFRFTLNTLRQAGTTEIAVGIDTDRKDKDSTDWGHGLGSLGPLGLEHVLATDGVRATLDKKKVRTTTSLARNQIDVVVPRSVLDPSRTATWRLYAVTGIADGKGNFTPLQDDPDATHPGGAHGTDAPPVFNAAFRFEVQHDETYSQGADCQGSRSVGCGNWNEQTQAHALAARDLSKLAADVSFAKLASRKSDTRLVPKFGYMNRILVSHLRFGEGVGDKYPWFLGALQPYSLYVPHAYRASKPAQFTLVLHSLSATHNQFEVFSPNIYRDLCEQRGAICLTTESRGPDGWYIGPGEVEVFEDWADVARRYALDPDRTTINGYSMGGYGTFRETTRFPDLFARSFPIVGPPGDGIWVPPADTVPVETNTYEILENYRNVPAFIWNGTNDELVPTAGTFYHAQKLDDLGYRYRQDYFTGADHFALSIVDSWARGKRFLGHYTVHRNPYHVTYRTVPKDWTPKWGLVPNHAYWVWGVQVRSNEGDPATGLVDATSLAFGKGEPVTQRIDNAGPNPLPHWERGWGWSKIPKVARKPKLEIRLENVKTVTIGLDRAGIHGNSLSVHVVSDGPGVIRFVGGGECLRGTVLHVQAGEQGMQTACSTASVSGSVTTGLSGQSKPLP